MPDDIKFQVWMLSVNKLIAQQLGGFTSEDIPDCPYSEWFEDEITPQRAAFKAIKRLGA